MPIRKTQLLVAWHLAPNPHWRMARHSHASHELLAVSRGRMRLAWPGGRCTVETGDALLYPAGLWHEEESDPTDPVESYGVTFRMEGLRPPRLLRARDDSGRLVQLLGWLYADQSSGDAQARAGRTSLLDAALAHFFRRDLAPEPELIRRLRHYARRHLDGPLSLADLAREARLSRHHLIRVYRRLIGCTPMRDVRHLRLERARNLLVTTPLPLKEIAVRTGLGDQYAFSRAFRAHFRQPPGRFRRHPAP